MKKTFLLFLLLTSSYLNVGGTVRFVSKTGSSTPPYTSWTTAADSIQKCIDISGFGDTIYVANGVYKERVYMIPGLALIGSGLDSCIINTQDMAVPVEFFSVLFADSCLFKEFTIDVSYGDDGVGINVPGGTKPGIIEQNKFINSHDGCRVGGAAIIIRNNIFHTVDSGINVNAPHPSYQQQISNNFFINFESYGIKIHSINGIIKNNIFYLIRPLSRGLIMFGSLDGLNIVNNTIISEVGYSGISTSLHSPINCINNIIIGTCNYAAISTGENCQILNNTVIKSYIGIRVEQAHYPIIRYNDIWKVNTPYIHHNPDSTNLSVDPMFVDAENFDFHLQMFSPLIDAGDPIILDKDGSRSDIGLYGGPYGESYTYQDLAPKPPKNLTASLDSGIVTLNWLPNTEADFYLYRVYRDTVPDFIYDTTKIIANVTDTTYSEMLPPKMKNYYYKITAIDSQYNQSPASEEVAIIVTGVEESKLIANDYQFYPNYPNPFNPSTILSYRLKEPGRVRLVIYDIKGERVTELVNKYQHAGYYEKEWDAKAFGLSSGIYIFRIEVINDNNIPVFSDMRKSILLK